MVISGQCLFWDWSFLTVSYGTSEVLPHFDIFPLWLVGIWTFSIYVCILGTVWPTFCWFFLQPYVHPLMYAQTNSSPKTKRNNSADLWNALWSSLISSTLSCKFYQLGLPNSDLCPLNSVRSLSSVPFPLPLLWPGNCLQTVSWGNCSSSFVNPPSTITVLHFLLCTV